MNRLVFLLFTVVSFNLFGQKNNIEKELRPLKAYRDELNKKTCHGDTIKYSRCKEKAIEFFALKKRNLIKIDSLDKIIRELNERGTKYYYYLYFIDGSYFNWAECNTEVINDSLERTFYFHDTNDYIYAKMKIEKMEKFGIHLFDGTSGQTFCREDIKYPIGQ